jgi:hypothetical protein
MKERQIVRQIEKSILQLREVTLNVRRNCSVGQATVMQALKSLKTEAVASNLHEPLLVHSRREGAITGVRLRNIHRRRQLRRLNRLCETA